VRSLQIENPRERALVRVADALLAPAAWWPRRRPVVGRILLLRLERIGDLLMALEAIADVRHAWPSATIDLAVGSWNAPIAALIPGISTVHVADVPWLSRGERPASWKDLIRATRAWRAGGYDMVINFEPDIRSNLLAWLSGAPIRVGYASGGGGSLLTHLGTYDPSLHVSENARRLAAAVAPATTTVRQSPDGRRLVPTPAQLARVDALLAGERRPLIGVHVSGGRPSKQWHLDRFAAVARAVAAATGGTIVLTGSAADGAMVQAVLANLAGTPVRALAGALDLPDTAALVSQVDVMITGDTGPMHLAAAMGAPVVALFGPSEPARYGPRARSERILRVQLPCSPCGQVRLPPVRCRGHVPDCMDGITVEAVVAAALELLAPSARQPAPRAEC
jgi:lipopolysaccharide heptosyltransferase II